MSRSKLQFKNASSYPWFRPHHLSFELDGKPATWNSRRARKGVHSLNWHELEGEEIGIRLRRVEGQLRPHLIVDVTFWIAVSFTMGSVVWVINGFLVFLPYLYPNVGTDAVNKTAGALGFIGGIIFEIGSYLMVVEALNRGKETNFGTALGQLLDDPHHFKRADSNEAWPAGKPGFVWWGPPHWHSMGYVAAVVQLFAASVFWVSTLTGLPNVIPGLGEGRHRAVAAVLFWTPQVIGGVFFVISSTILTLETQRHWWLPEIFTVGWNVGFWNIVGSFGFLLCGALGYSGNHGVQFQSSLATFWGSWAFLIGSGFQLWEAVWREPPPKTPPKRVATVS